MEFKITFPTFILQLVQILRVKCKYFKSMRVKRSCESVTLGKRAPQYMNSNLIKSYMYQIRYKQNFKNYTYNIISHPHPPTLIVG